MQPSAGRVAGSQTPPGRPKRGRQRASAPKQLNELFCDLEPVTPSVPVESWRKEENKALVEFVLFHGDPNTWPSFGKRNRFWEEAAEFVQKRTKSVTKHTGKLGTIENMHVRILSHFYVIPYCLIYM